MKRKSIEYLDAQSYITDKRRAINSYIAYSLDKLQQMFIYSGLPDTIPAIELERYLLRKGHCVIAQVDGALYALTGGFTGPNDAYENPRYYTVSNVALNLTRTYEIDVDCVLVKNDTEMIGLLPHIKKYGALLTEADITVNMTTILSRMLTLISASDDKTKSSGEKFLNDLYDGKFGVIGENAFLDGIKTHDTNSVNSRYITQFIELIQYYKASFLNDIGLNSNYNMKRERLVSGEVALDVDAIFPFVDNMRREREDGIDRVNKLFNTDIHVDFNGVWRMNHENMENATALLDTDLDIVTSDGDSLSEDDTVVSSDNDDTDSDNDAKDDSDDDNREDKTEV